jgi:osmotically-inducible protein OsmY
MNTRNTASMMALAISILLSGCSSIVGTTTNQPLQENYKSRSLGAMLDDESIETKALVNIRKLSPSLDDAHVVVVSYNGNVLLAGQVPNEEDRTRAAEAASVLKQVRRVTNELTVSSNTDFWAGMSDSWITTKLKFKCGDDVKIVTEQGTVYLLGLVSRDFGNSCANKASETNGVQRVVQMFEYIES